MQQSNYFNVLTHHLSIEEPDKLLNKTKGKERLDTLTHMYNTAGATVLNNGF